LVNDTTEKWAPCRTIDQLGHSLKQIIHVFMEADNDAKVLMAKWDIQDEFWQLNCCKGEEWNFCYVWPQAPGEPRRLVVPSSLQMGWVELAPYFCMASEMAQDVAIQYIDTEIGLLLHHKFEQWAGMDVTQINKDTPKQELRYVLEVYMNNYIATMVPTPKAQITHIARGILHGIHNVFPLSKESTTAKTQSQQRNYKRATAHSKARNAYWVLTLTTTAKKFGWKKKRGQHY
jgi:hypothetical protein